MPRAIESIDLSGFDMIVSSSHAVGKGIIPPSNAVHVCYCHTPMRYAWEMENEYLQDFRIPRFLWPKLKRILKRIRRWDLATAKRVDVFIANSTETQKRIQNIYGRESIVIPPPVDDRFFEQELVQNSERAYYLALGRLVPYKKFDLLIQVANTLQLPLVIAGTGHELSRLKALAGPTVQFAGFVPDKDLPALYGRAKALLFPQYEDAGIVPLEAEASGTPVIAFDQGGAKDSVQADTTGVFFAEQSAESLQKAIEEFEKKKFDPEVIREHAKQFSGTEFRRKILETVQAASKVSVSH
jgi:glycosyltransferase involved in cell wall biosynthesis